MGMDHPVDGFVDGSVSASHQNQICSTVHGAARDLAGVSRSAGGNRIDSDAARVQQLNGPLKRMASPPECARVWIINKYWLTVGRDSTLIIINMQNLEVHSIRCGVCVVVNLLVGDGAICAERLRDLGPRRRSCLSVRWRR